VKVQEVSMKMTDFFSAQVEREAPVSRRVLERVPEGKNAWKPHEKSMPLGYLATLVASMPSWIAYAITLDELDINPAGGSKYKPADMTTARALVESQEEAVGKALAALRGTNDDHLRTPWKLLAAGRVVALDPRYIVIADAFTHLAHHRGQLTVYLRLNGAAVPSVYGPSADERGFGPSS
jgi:uncharacterized damage-inducible protein DinB